MQSETTVNFEALGQTFHQEFAEFRKEFDEVRNLVDSLTTGHDAKWSANTA